MTVTKTIKGFLHSIFSSNAYGLMVVNGNYYKPMANKKNSLVSPTISDAKYLEICSQIRRADR